MATQADWEATAARIFTSFANQLATVTYSQYVPGSYNAATDSYDGTPTTKAISMAVLKSRDKNEDPRVRTLEALAKGKDFRDSPAIAEPLSVNDTLTYESDTYRITEIERIPESSAPIVYRFRAATRAK